MRSFHLLPALLLLATSAQAQLLQPEWGSYFGGSAEDWGDAVAVRTDGFIALSGRTASPENIAFNAAQETFAGGDFDAYAALFNDQGLLQWATYLGGPGQDYASGVAVDGAGRVFIAGHTDSEEGIAFNAGQASYGGGFSDGFLAGYSPEGALLWSTYLGGPDLDAITGVAASSAGQVYVVGNTRSATGIATAGSNQSFFGGGNSDAFLAKYDADGTLLWSTYIGGTAVDYGDAVHVGADGMVYVCGSTQSLNGIQAGLSHQGGLGGGRDGFLMKFSADGVRQWGTYYGGSGFDQALAVTTDAAGSVYLAGSTSSTNNIAANGHQNALSSGFDGFLARFNANGVRQWGTYYGGPNFDDARGIAAEAAGTVLLAGQSGSPTGIATPDGFQPVSAGGSEGYVARFAADGTRLWASYVGGPAGDGLFAAHAHPDGWAVVSGNTMSASGITTTGAHQELYGGAGDGFLIKLASDISTSQQEVDRSGVQLVFDAVQELAQLVPAAPSQIIVIDVHGRVVREAGRSDRVSLAGLPAGAYVLRVQAQDAVTTFRLVKP
jgi:hypothetical protein